MPSSFAESPEGHAYAELCRAYGKLPSELPPPGTAERAFLEAEFHNYLDRYDHSPNHSPF